MNTTKNLEMQLRSWTPRRPSDKVETRLFGKRRDARSTLRVGLGLGMRLNWLAPAAAGLLVMGMVLHQRNGPAVSGEGTSPMAAMIPSNQLAAAMTADTPSNLATVVTGKTFEWTNDRSSTSSIGSLSRAKGTN